jgi:hypothetical protein
MKTYNEEELKLKLMAKGIFSELDIHISMIKGVLKNNTTEEQISESIKILKTYDSIIKEELKNVNRYLAKEKKRKK